MKQQALDRLANRYCDHLSRIGYRCQQVNKARNQLEYFCQWASQAEVIEVNDLSIAILLAYHAHLNNHVNPDGTSYHKSFRRERLAKLRRFLKWLYQSDFIDRDLSPHVPCGCKATASVPLY